MTKTVGARASPLDGRDDAKASLAQQLPKVGSHFAWVQDPDRALVWVVFHHDKKAGRYFCGNSIAGSIWAGRSDRIMVSEGKVDDCGKRDIYEGAGPTFLLGVEDRRRDHA